jgi:hypothetical protein
VKERQLLFKVMMGVGGHEYRVYEDGEIEGFGDGAIVINYFPALLSMYLAQASSPSGISDPTCDTRPRSFDLAGAAHGEPE